MFSFTQAGAKLYCPSMNSHLPRLKRLAVVSHPDDAEILAIWAIIQSWIRAEEKFGVVVINDGVGRPRAPKYEPLTDPQMRDLRIDEQFAAAKAGAYTFAISLAYPSGVTKRQRNFGLITELSRILSATAPDEVYTHNPFDIHESHISVLEHCLWALNICGHLPKKLYGGEVWGCMDWIPEPYRVCWDCSSYLERQQELLRCFTSQNAVKGYDEMVMARRRTLAKLNDPHECLRATAVHLGIDLTGVMEKTMPLGRLIDHCDELNRSSRAGRYSSLEHWAVC